MRFRFVSVASFLYVELSGLPITYCAAESRKGDNDSNGGKRHHHVQNQQPRQSQDSWEDLILSLPDAGRLQSHLYNLTQTDHVAGTRGDFQDAKYVYEAFQSYFMRLEGDVKVKVKMEEIPAMLSYPIQPAQLYTPTFRAKLSEDVIPEDETSGSASSLYWGNHTFLAYSPAGAVTAPLIYANYGRPQDFDVLENRLNISVRGKIVLMRYGECFRGLKIMNAERRGAVGTLIYSDPQQDGFVMGPTYPQGPWRPPSSVQRGSTQFNSICGGDPFRLYLNKTKNLGVKDICGYESKDLIPSRPALPISYEDALPLLQRLGGPKAPEDFQGGLVLEDQLEYYTTGPSEELVTLETFNRNVPKTIPNVYAKIQGTGPGSIILGNHRDAWVFGAIDPNSGTTVLLEVARSLARLLSQGWKPQRSIYLMSWSGEEYGLVGSTAFTELHPEITAPNIIHSWKDDNQLDDSPSEAAIAYLNVDCAVKGRDVLKVAATHSLTRLVWDAAKRIPAPSTSNTRNKGNSALARENRNETLFDMIPEGGAIQNLGSGSDYTSFLDHFGIISLDMSFQNAQSDTYGVYHSIYDSFSYASTQGDPGFLYHRAMAQLWMLMAFKLASDEILPIQMTDQAKHLAVQVGKLAQVASQSGLDLTPLVAAIEVFREAAEIIDQERLDATVGASNNNETSTSAAFLRASSVSKKNEERRMRDLNERLAYAERQFLVKEGLPRRPWFRHILQAPGYFLGYKSQSFPGIAQAMEDGDLETARSEVDKATLAVLKAARFLQRRQGGGMQVQSHR